MNKQELILRLAKFLSFTVLLTIVATLLAVLTDLSSIIVYAIYIAAILVALFVVAIFFNGRRTQCAGCKRYGVMKIISKEITKKKYQTTESDALQNLTDNASGLAAKVTDDERATVVKIKDGILHKECNKCGYRDAEAFTVKR